MANKFGLGKGLGAIFMENETEDKNEVVNLKISEIEPNKKQPRKDFDEKALSDLSQSIMQYGVLQPILVRPLLGGGYQIVAGERRYRASRIAGLTEVPVVIRELSDSETMEIALIENIQREDLSVIEEAKGYQELIDKFSYSQEQLSKIIGKSRSAIANILRLLSLPESIKQDLNDNKITPGHARALLSINDKAKMLEVELKVIENDLSVRETERLCKNCDKKKDDQKKEKVTPVKKPSYFSEVELALSEYLGRKVIVTKGKDDNHGTLSIDFYSQDELKELANKLEDK